MTAWVVAMCIAFGGSLHCKEWESENRNVPDAFDTEQGCSRWIEKHIIAKGKLQFRCMKAERES